MSRCQDCHFFRSPVLVGRKERTCEDLGERPSNRGCANFQPKWKAKDEFALALKSKASSSDQAVVRRHPEEEARAKIAQYSQQSTQVVLEHILSDAFNVAQDSHLAVNHIGSLLEQQGADVEFSPTQYRVYTDKLMDLTLLHQLGHALGMSAYLDQIMAYEIANKFAKAPTQPAIIRRPPEEI